MLLSPTRTYGQQHARVHRITGRRICGAVAAGRQRRGQSASRYRHCRGVPTRRIESVIRDTTDPTVLQIALRNTTVYEGPEYNATLNQEAIKSGVSVAVWYRSVGERRPVADKVRVLRDAIR